MALETQVIAWLAEQNTDVYMVGGCVRDWLLERPIYDLDLAVSGEGLALARRLANHFRGAYYPLDEVRGTGRALLQGEGGQRLMVDVAQFRGDCLAADLADRDFTINALALDVRAPDEVIDHFDGLSDLEAGLLRPVSDEIVRNDPVRALRAIRQAAQLGFTLAPETETLIRRDGAALVRVSGERIRDEFTRLLALPRAASSLRQVDALGLLTTILPELEPLRDLAQPPPHHLDVLAHSLETVHALETLLVELCAPSEQQHSMPNAQYSISDILFHFADKVDLHLNQIMSDTRPRLVTLKLAALLHDTGKASARTVDESGQIRFIGHHEDGAVGTGKMLRRLRLSRPEVRLGETIVRHHMRPLLLANQKSVSSRAVYRFFRATGDAGVDILLHALADHMATYAPDAAGLRSADDHWPRLVDLTARMLADYWQRGAERVTPPPLVSGSDLLREFDLQPGPHIGELLEAVREAQVSGEVRTRGEALALVRTLQAGEQRRAG